MRILITETAQPSVLFLNKMELIGEVICADLDRTGLLIEVRTAEILWVKLRHYIDREVMDAAPKLRFIVTPTTGLTHIDCQEAERRDIRIISLQGESDFLKDIRATAELTIGLIFALIRRIPQAVAHVNQGRWDRDSYIGADLFGKTAGVVGYGRLGRIVARYLKAFDMRVLAADPYLDQDDMDKDVQLVELDGLLSAADLVTVHVNVTPDTMGMFDTREFSAMKSGSWFVNTSRGELVDEDALLSTLKKGKLSGAAVDVLTGESSAGMTHHPLVRYASTHDNLLITPHLGGCTIESMEKTEQFLAQKLMSELKILKT